MARIILYQVMPRYFGNSGANIPFGSIGENGCGKFDDFTPEALASIRQLGCTHLWLTGVLEHATQTDYSACSILPDHPWVVKGKAGSPYAVKDYYDVDPDLATDPSKRREEFTALLGRAHDAGFKVIIDFVPNHVARQYRSDSAPAGVRDFGVDDHKEDAFNPNNNFYYFPCQKLKLDFIEAGPDEKPYEECPARATGNDCFTPAPGRNDWYETVKLNYGVDFAGGGSTYFHTIPDTWFKMLDVLVYWAGKGVDGFRCDMAEMVPLEFWSWVIPRVKAVRDVLFIAEIYQPYRYESFVKVGKFDYLYDKEDLYNVLRAVTHGHLSASAITRCWQSVGAVRDNMLRFLENHDEQRIASDFFAGDPVKGFPAMLVLSCMDSNPVMIYAGQELGERGMYSEGFSGLDGRSTIFDYWSIPSVVAWKNQGLWNEDILDGQQRLVRRFYQKLLTLCAEEPALRQGAFFDLMYANQEQENFNPDRVYAFLRKQNDDLVLALANFSDQSCSIRLNIPKHAFECLSVPDERELEMNDLLSDQTIIRKWSSSEPLPLEVSPWGAVLWKSNLKG